MPGPTPHGPSDAPLNGPGFGLEDAARRVAQREATLPPMLPGPDREGRGVNPAARAPAWVSPP